MSKKVKLFCVGIDNGLILTEEVAAFDDDVKALGMTRFVQL
ncbi:MAG: hypothetical protein ACOX0E_05575 [Syntrophomonadaceae bacterium]